MRTGLLYANCLTHNLQVNFPTAALQKQCPRKWFFFFWPKNGIIVIKRPLGVPLNHSTDDWSGSFKLNFCFSWWKATVLAHFSADRRFSFVKSEMNPVIEHCCRMGKGLPKGKYGRSMTGISHPHTTCLSTKQNKSALILDLWYKIFIVRSFKSPSYLLWLIETPEEVVTSTHCQTATNSNLGDARHP